jgi:dTDP-4-dehydrorhamnose reductase
MSAVDEERPHPEGRVAYTGAWGMLGKEVIRAAAARGIDLLPWDLDDFDLTDREATQRAVTATRPRVVIHGAAWTDVDSCESDRAKAVLVNGRGTANLAAACREAGARLLMVSTDYVFSGRGEKPYRETDPPGPLSVYGWSKLIGEEAVLALGEDGAIARTAWLYADHGKNFLRTMLALAEEREEIAVVDDQRGSPTFAADLAHALLDLAAVPASGVFHTTNRGAVTWCGFARHIFELAGRDVRVKPVPTAEFPRPALRPTNSVLENTRFAELGLPPLPTWEEGLERCLARLVGPGVL